MMKKYIPKKSTKTEGKSSPVVYIISKEFTFEMISVRIFHFYLVFSIVHECNFESLFDHEIKISFGGFYFTV